MSGDVALEIAHVLLMDVVGYSKLLINDQSEILEQLNRIVRDTVQFREADVAGKLIRLATGDGMALIFFNNPEAPVKCALEISQALQSYPHIRLRMGVHSGPINPVSDVNDRTNVTGAGINIAQRVMDCGDAGHILLSRRVAEDLEQYRQWQPYLHNLGECEAKHGARIHVFNFFTDKLGNRDVPIKLESSYSSRNNRARRLFAVSTVLLLLLGVVAACWLITHRPTKSISNSTPVTTSPGSSVPEKSIAVLPLQNLSEEKENAFFADGIQDELLSNLARIRDLKVISRSSVMQYRSGITRNLREIAQQLGVSNVVEGSVRRSGNRVRVSVQLIDALTDRHIWAQNYDRTLADSLAMQGELAMEIATTVGAKLSLQEKARVEAKPTTNAAAYDAYLRGRTFKTGVSWSGEDAEKAIKSYQEAVKLDPNFTLAWAYLSCALTGHYRGGPDPSPTELVPAKDALDHAIALDPNLPETHLALGYYRYYGQLDYAEALAEFQRAEQGLPNNVDILQALVLIQRRLGHWDDSLEAAHRAVELDPRNVASSIVLAETYRIMRRFPEELATADRILAFEPTNEDAFWLKTRAYWSMGDLNAVEPLLANPGFPPELRGLCALFQRRYTDAIDIFSKELAHASTNDDKRFFLFPLALAQLRAGDVAAAHATYEQAIQVLKDDLERTARHSHYKDHVDLGLAHAGLGEAQPALAEGQKAMAALPTSKDPYEGPEAEEGVARIYALLGDADRAIPILQRLLQTPYANSINAGLLRLQPDWDPIRNDPRFQELVAEKKP
jgi:TolB-like protein/class 3 adenylate cyclase/Tfp pilus assembly protein PilF